MFIGAKRALDECFAGTYPGREDEGPMANPADVVILLHFLCCVESIPNLVTEAGVGRATLMGH